MQRFFKKFLIIFFTFLLAVLFIFSGCKNNGKSSLLPYISELKKDILFGENETYVVCATCGYEEVPLNLDGKVDKTQNKLTVFLTGENKDAKTEIGLHINGEIYKQTLTYDPISSKGRAAFPLDIKEKSLTVSVYENGRESVINLKSKIPEDTVDYETALKTFEKSQKNLISNYTENGVFKGEISMRILEKEGKAYYYLGLTDKTGKTKALLIDGKSCDILAVRDIF